MEFTIFIQLKSFRLKDFFFNKISPPHLKCKVLIEGKSIIVVFKQKLTTDVTNM